MTDDDVADAFDALFAPPPDATEVAPGLFARAIFSVWYPGRGEKRPGRIDAKHDEIRSDEAPEFGVTVLFFRTPDSKRGDVRYRESLTLPAKAEWPEAGGGTALADFPAPVRPKTTIRDDGRTCITEQTVTLAEGQLIPSFSDGERFYLLSPFPSIEWEVADTDPPGDWTIEASINDKPLLRKTFKVVMPQR
jgi:hypothetical protein